MILRAIGMATAATVLSFGVAPRAEAGPIISCASTTAGRNFQVEITTGTGNATCVAADPANINGEDTTFLNYTFIDQDPDANPSLVNEGWLTNIGLGESSGSFQIADSAWAAYNSMILVFKSTSGGSPYAAAFMLTPTVLAGDWRIIPSREQQLTQVSLFGGNVARNTPTAVPEPASIALLGLGLAGLARATRRRRQHMAAGSKNLAPVRSGPNDD